MEQHLIVRQATREDAIASARRLVGKGYDVAILDDPTVADAPFAIVSYADCYDVAKARRA